MRAGPFAWTTTVDEIFDRLSSHRGRINKALNDSVI
jgi:hypothetical protein